MSAAEQFQKAMAELKSETAASIQQHRADARALADMTTRLNAALQGQVTDVDVASLAAQIHDAAQDLANGIASSHTDAVGAQTANAGTSHVQGAASSGPDVVSASSPGVIVPPASGTEASNAVPETLGGGAMPRKDAPDGALGERAPGSTLPPASPEPEEKPAEPLPPKADEEKGAPVAEPAVPAVSDVPSSIHDNAPDSARK